MAAQKYFTSWAEERTFLPRPIYADNAKDLAEAKHKMINDQ